MPATFRQLGVARVFGHQFPHRIGTTERGKRLPIFFQDAATRRRSRPLS